MAEYQLTPNPHIMLRTEDQAYIPDDPANLDYQEYLTWLDEGNTPDPPETTTENVDVSSQDQG